MSSLLLLTPQTSQAEDACAIIQREGAKILASGRPSSSTVAGVIGRHVAVSSWAKSTLGQPYNQLTKAQQSAYREAFHRYLVAETTSLARRFPGRSLTVVRGNCHGSGQIVTRYTRSSGAETTVYWQVTLSSGRVWISDVSVGGQSLRATIGGNLRNAFARGGYRALMEEIS